MIRTFARWQDVDPATLRGHCAVVIDVLRWSTVVVTALAHGAEWVEAWATPAEAEARARELGRDRVVLGGERGNVALPGFDIGNSPAEPTEERLAGRGLVTTTSNGTQGLLAAREAASVLVGAFVNLPAVAAALAQQLDAGVPLALVACGRSGEVAEEDLACAGALATRIGANVTDVTTERACGAWARAGREAATAVGDATHAAALRAAGFAGDVTFAGRVGVYQCVPRLAGGHRLLASYGSPPAPSPS